MLLLRASLKKMPQQVLMSRFTVAEGLQRNSLNWLVQPVLSIDQFESKISDQRVIVVGFYCTDRAPAEDLSRFIDLSGQPILDTEVSPAPTAAGHWVVWVELARDTAFPQVLTALLSEVDNLTTVSQWQFESPGVTAPLLLNRDNLQQRLILDPAEVPAAEATDATNATDNTAALAEFLRPAWVDRLLIEGNVVTLLRGQQTRRVKITTQCPDQLVWLTETAASRELAEWLGPEYSVWPAEQGCVLLRDGHMVWATNA